MALLLCSNFSAACTNITLSVKNNYFVGRNFDWPVKQSFLVINPIGLSHQSDDLSVKNKPLKWVSQYGSVTIDLAAQDNHPDTYAVMDGINQYGLTAAALWLQDSIYPEVFHTAPISTVLWVQYILDNAKSVKEAIALSNEITIEPVVFNGQKILLHMIIHDASGDSAVLEYLHGKLMIYQGKDFSVPVLTNDNYADSLESLKKYQDFGGRLSLPTGYDSEDRFIRAASFLQETKALNSDKEAIDQVFNILNKVSEPIGAPGGATMWSVVYDLSNKTLYYRDIDNIKIRDLHLSQFDFSKGTAISYLLLNNKLNGNTATEFSRD